MLSWVVQSQNQSKKLTSAAAIVGVALTAMIVLVANEANAAFKGSIAFTESEKVSHLATLPVILKTSAACLEGDMKRHYDFYTQFGISPFYGSNSAYSKMSPAERRQHLIQLGKNPALVSEMQSTSCVGLTMKCLGRGFEAAGQADLWKRLKAYTVLNGVDGTALQDGLQKLGWKILYWNADTSQNKKWDAEEQARHPGNKDHFWGYHESNWQAVVKRGRYYYDNVDDITSLVNFGKKVPEAIKSVEFFVGTSHMGYHVFPGTYGKIIEGHSTRRLTDPRTLQAAPFNPIGGGGPTDGEYRSGIVAVPPGSVN
jgi:hypothetical protein